MEPVSSVWTWTWRLGDMEAVVTVVLAVAGRSSDSFVTAAPEVEGSLPVSSRRLILDLSSSSSSQTVEGAVVEAVDSVPSTPFWMSWFCGGGRSKDRTKGDEWNVLE